MSFRVPWRSVGSNLNLEFLMLKLWLARHGEAVGADVAGSDFARRLTDVGRQRLSALARWLIERESPPELILHSPLVRARQTAETIAEEIGLDPVVIRVEPLLEPGIDTADLLKRITSSGAGQVLCIGHQPDMSRCLAEMIGGGHFQYSPGTIAGVEFSGPVVRHAGSLRWLADPRWFG
jgi:phosphohistidine phosphatase